VTPERSLRYEEYADKIAAATDGRIDIEYFFSGALVPAAEMAAAVGEGTLDMAFTWGGYHKGLIPEGEVEGGLPMSWGNIHQACLFHYVYPSREIFREAYAEHNVRFVCVSLESPSYAISKEPFTKLEDATHLKFRCTAAIGELMSKFGISSVYLPSEEFYTALATGVIDAIIYGSDGSYFTMKLHEQAEYIIDMQMLNPYTSALLLNMDSWNALDDDLKEIVDSITQAHFTLEYWKHSTWDTWDAKDAGVFTYLNLDGADIAALTSEATSMWDEIAKANQRTADLIELLKVMNRAVGKL
jgi:TRAP-type mannitol/chloroaromatic compound transport system substrate-binding protein